MPGPSRTYSSTSTGDTTAAASQQALSNAQAALLGAATAFYRDPSRPRASPQHTGGSLTSNKTGTSTISTTSDAGRKLSSTNVRPPPPRSPQSYVESPVGVFAQEEERRGRATLSLDTRNVPLLTVPKPQGPGAQSRSPSQQAAMMATARALGPTPAAAKPVPRAPTVQTTSIESKPVVRPAVKPKPRKLSLSLRTGDGGVDSQDDLGSADDTPIASTTSLVSLFEQKSQPSTPRKLAAARQSPIIVGKPAPDLTVSSPKPVRKGGITSMIQMELGGEVKRSESNLTTALQKEQFGSGAGNSLELVAGQSPNRATGAEAGNSGPSDRTSTLNGQATLQAGQQSSVLQRAASRPPGAASRSSTLPPPTPTRYPTISPTRASATSPIEIRSPPPRPQTSHSLASTRSIQSIHAQYNQANPKRQTALRTGDELANALVASSLASSRAPSPHKLEPAPPPPPTRRKKKHHHTFGFSRTPSPAKTTLTGGGGTSLPKTLRAAPPSDSDDDSSSTLDSAHPYHKHQKKRLVRKHPNKHHEGDRKRWRDAVTDRERKRYEGIWAANKGLHVGFSAAEETYFDRTPRQDPEVARVRAEIADQVSGVVVREIWKRSRLPDTVLEMVWDLVDEECNGRLGKESFVVGLWLIDQRLKGRKLPVKVTESVWTSVRGLRGITVPKG